MEITFFTEKLSVKNTNKDSNKLMNKQNILKTATLALTCAAASLTIAQAATITWDAPASASGDGSTDVITAGTSVYAYQYGTLTSDLTINGVTFQSTTDTTADSFASTSNASQQGDIGVIAGTTGDYESLLRQNIWNAASVGTWTLSGLTDGNDYTVQFWVADTRYGAAQASTFSDGTNVSDPLLISTGQYVTGTFTADATTQAITIAGDGVFNAMQLRTTAVPEPSSTALLGLGGLALILRRRK